MPAVRPLARPASPSTRLAAALVPSLLLAFPLLLGGCGRHERDMQMTEAPGRTTVGAAPNAPLPPQGSQPRRGPTGAAAPADDGQWTMATKDYANTRYSTLAQIDTATVKNLQLKWTFETGVLRGHEEAPLVVGSTMYIVTPYPNILYALDLTKEGALRWKYEPKPMAAAQGVACCDVVNRGPAYADGKIFYNTLDAHTVAVDASTGRELWRTKVGDIQIGETVTMAPMVAKGKVFVGNSGGELGVRGWITALDASTGKIAWRAYNTGPDNDVLIGARFRPFYPSDSGVDLGVKTWPPDKWKIGGGNVWGFLAYDPELDLLYHGTGNPGSWNPELRPGDNKWSTGVFARDPDDGQAVWYYQSSPHDLFDHDGINESILVDLPWQGQPRKLMLRPERNGFFYVMDRTSGQVLSATAYGYVNSAKGVDLKTGRLIPNDAKQPQTGKVVREICPAAPGLKDWQPAAWSPKLRLVFLPHQNLCMDWEGVEASYIAGTPYVGVNTKFYAGPGGHRGELLAWDPLAAKPVWSVKERFPVWSGTVVTAGDVVFYGTMDGYFKAVNARTGAPLWQFKVGSGIISQPVTYRGPDGKQYVAVVSGVGGWSGAIVAAGLDPRDSTAGGGFVNAMRDLPQYTGKGGTVYVFALP
ncbi:MAG TPA: methanol/ethanol family PQQ-dependent dehydrogenase [Gemmatimonadales bacterium]|nr:methanol/ethanol family PQQ-dependent dehydrogenase [Gemmatimonadales bacterium]